MTYYAVDALGDALDATQSYLLPFDRSRWLRLALVGLFLGGAGSGSSVQSGGTNVRDVTPSATGPPNIAVPDLGSIAVLLAVAGVLVILALLYVFVGSVMEFVFVESLRSESVRVRSYFRRYLRAGARLFGFRVVLGLVTLVSIAVPVLVAFGALRGSGSSVDAGVGAVVLLVPIAIGIAVVAGVVSGLTTTFVVPVMLAEDRGVVSGWRRFWPTLRGQWKQYVVYAVIALVASIAAGIAVVIVDVIAVVVMGILVGVVVGAVLFVAGGVGGLSTISVVVLAAVGIAFVLAAVVVFLLVQMPVLTYFRYYGLLVLGDTNDAFDLISERRAAIRSNTPSTAE